MLGASRILVSLLLVHVLTGTVRADYVVYRSFTPPIIADLVLDLPGVTAREGFSTRDPAAIAAFTAIDGGIGAFAIDMTEVLDLDLTSSADGSTLDSGWALLTGIDRSLFLDDEARLVALTFAPGGGQLFTALGSGATNWVRLGAARLPYDAGASFLHLSHALNTSGAATILHHPQLDGYPEATLIVTRHYDPGPSGLTIDDVPIAVAYDTGQGVWTIVNADGSPMQTGIGYNVLLPPQSLNAAVLPARAFTHVVTNAANLTRSQIDHPTLFGRPGARPFITQNLTPPGGSTSPSDLGVPTVYFDGTTWSIANHDGTSLPLGAAFNIYVPPESDAFTHTADPNNTLVGGSTIDDPRLNGDERALVHITRVAAPGTAAPGRRTAVTYLDGAGVWAIGNLTETSTAGDVFHVLALPRHALAYQPFGTFLNNTLVNDRTSVNPQVTLLEPFGAPGLATGVGTAYLNGEWRIAPNDGSGPFASTPVSVDVPALDASASYHLTTPSNISGNSTYIINPLSDQDLLAMVFVTPAETSAGITPENLGVWYSANVWLIFNQSGAPMQPGLGFHVYVARNDDLAYIHLAIPATLEGDRTWLIDPALDNHPEAIPLVTQNWAHSNVYNDHPIAVVWDSLSGRWAIRNADGAPMPANAAFNVLVRPATCGDADLDGLRSDEDVLEYRELLAGLPAFPSLSHCSVIGGPDDCDIADVVVLRRTTVLRGNALPAPQPVCRAFVGN